MKQTLRFILTQILRPMVPVLVTGAVILGCANAPQLQNLPELLQLDQPSSVETTPEPAPTPHPQRRRFLPRLLPSPAMTLSQLAGAYPDGSYIGSAQGYGGTITVQVTISGGSISDIAVVSAPGETASYFASAQGVISSVLSAQSPNVDTVSGATFSSGGLREATGNALSQAEGT